MVVDHIEENVGLIAPLEEVAEELDGDDNGITSPIDETEEVVPLECVEVVTWPVDETL